MIRKFTLLVISLMACIAPIVVFPQFVHQFSHGIGGTDFESGFDVATDAEGNVFITGAFRDTIDFDPGPAVHNLNGTDASDAFLAKYTASGDFVWAHSFGTRGFPTGENDIGQSVNTDAAGNVYMGLSFGTFQDSIDIDPGPDTVSITCRGFVNGILAKYDANGNFIWAIPILTTSASGFDDIVIDETGNVYAIGGFNGTYDFDLGAGTANLTSNGNNDIFVAKYDNDGNFIWAFSMGGPGLDGGTSIALTPGGAVLVTGNYKGDVDFDPGPGVVMLPGVNNSSEGFFARYDEDGDLQWAHSVHTPGSDGGSAIISDADGNVIVAGQYSGDFDFDPGSGTFTLSPSGGSNIFLAKYDVGGNFVLAKAIGSPQGQTFGNMTSDGGSGFYISGSFSGTIDFNPGSTPVLLTAFALRDGYFARYNSNGECIGAGAISGTNTDDNLSIASADGDNIFITGTFSETADFDPGPGVFNHTSLGISDIILAKYQFGGPLPVSFSRFTAQCNSNGVQLDWTTQQESNSRSFIIEQSNDGINYHAIAELPSAKNSSNPVHYQYINNKETWSRTFYRLKQTDNDGKFMYSKTITTNCGKLSMAHAFPNPVSGILFLSLKEKISKAQISILNATGQVIKQLSFDAEEGEMIPLDMRGLVSGSYYVLIKNVAKGTIQSIKVLKN